MVIVNLKGGLGNQMFEYAAGRSLAIKHNTELKLDTTFLLDRSPQLNSIFRDYDLDIFPNLSVSVANKKETLRLKSYIDRSFKSSILNRLNSKSSLFRETKFSYHEDFQRLTSNTYLDGYWQSEKYFKSIEPIIRGDFSFSTLSIEKNYSLKDEITNQNSICINVRRGDFVNNKHSASEHGFVGLDYILNGVKLIINLVKSPFFYIFSDDIEWCQQNIKLDFPSQIVDHSHAGKKFADYLQLMSSCSHFIIPNSSFAWWAAWLNCNPDKIVVAPKKWFNNGPKDTQDLIPEGWIKI